MAGLSQWHAGEKIPLWARIMAITDAYVNMTSASARLPPPRPVNRPWRAGKLSGTRYDGMLVRILIRWRTQS